MTGLAVHYYHLLKRKKKYANIKIEFLCLVIKEICNKKGGAVVPAKDNGKQNIEELTTDELLEKIEADKKQLKKSSVFAFAALIAIITLAIAWFVSNNRVSGTTGTVSANSLPYCIATKETTTEENANYQSGLKEILENKFNVGKGSKLKIDNDTYYVSNGENICIQVSEDNNLNNNEENETGGIAPGTSGKITFYVIPREDGYKKFSFQMNLTAYQETGAEIQEINNNDVKSFLKGHVLFFRNYKEDTGYTDRIENGNIFTIKNENGFSKNEPIPVTVYWVWPEYFQSFMKSGELFNTDEVIQSFLKDMNTETNSSSSDKKYFYGFEDSQFDSEKKFDNENMWAFDSLNANQYLYLTECYNAADFQIGSNVKYIYVDFELNEAVLKKES